jgi:hypothetical protein
VSRSRNLLPSGRRGRQRTGDNPGFRALHVRLPELDASLIVLSNQAETDVEAVALTLLEHFPEVFEPGAPATEVSR